MQVCGKFCCPSSTIILAFVMQKLKTYLKNFFAMINKDWGDTAVMREAYSTWEIPHNIGLCHAKIENIPKKFFCHDQQRLGRHSCYEGGI